MTVKKMEPSALFVSDNPFYGKSAALCREMRLMESRVMIHSRANVSKPDEFTQPVSGVWEMIQTSPDQISCGYF